MDRIYGNPISELLDDSQTRERPNHSGLSGKFFSLYPVAPAEHVSDLYHVFHSDEQRINIRSYIPFTMPFEYEYKIQTSLYHNKEGKSLSDLNTAM